MLWNGTRLLFLIAGIQLQISPGKRDEFFEIW